MTQERSQQLPKGDTARILVAEDHHDSREALRILLESVAVDGRKALTTALSQPPDLILLDIMMPEMDGFEVTRQLRGNHATVGVPIIAVTAMHGARERALEAGADAVVDKPIDIRALLATVQSWLGEEVGT